MAELDLFEARFAAAYRRHLAQAMLQAQDAGLGLPPSLLGGDAEMVGPAEQQPCPSPTHASLLVANLSCGQQTEILVVNPSRDGLKLAWESPVAGPLCWTDASGQPVSDLASSLSVPARGWILGRAGKLEGL